MKVALLRIGIDSGSGGMQGPLFRDGSFELMPIPDKKGIDHRTYGNITGRNGRCFIEYFPESKRPKMRDQSVHLDPEFTTFTYGDPTRLKRGLRLLERGDLLVFYCGLQGCGFDSPPALYIAGYFEVEMAGWAKEFSSEDLRKAFSENFHVRHPKVYDIQKNELVLVRGTSRSRLLRKACCLSTYSKDKAGKPLKVISPEMQEIFGDFKGKTSIQRSPPRWVDEGFVNKAASFVRSLE